MIKKLLIVFLVCSFFTATFPMNALAANQPSDEELLEDTLMLMKMDLETMDQTGDLAIITSKTQQLIDELLLALKDGDPEKLQSIIDDYAAEVNLIQEQQLVEECRNALLLGVFFSSLSLVQTIAGGGDPVCVLIGATNSIADMMSDMQSYQLCVIETSEDPDDALREAICQQQRAVETYDAITNLLDVALCTPEPTFFTYLGLIMNIRGVFTICQEEE